MNVVLFSGFQENLVMNKSIHCCISFPLFIHYTDESFPSFIPFFHSPRTVNVHHRHLPLYKPPPPSQQNHLSYIILHTTKSNIFQSMHLSYYINYISSIHSARSSKFTGESQGDLCPAETVSHHLYLRAKRHRAIVLRESILVKRTRNQSNL